MDKIEEQNAIETNDEKLREEVSASSVISVSEGGAAILSDSEPAIDEEKITRVSGEEEETYKEISPIRLVLRRFFRSKLSIVGLVMIVFLFVFSFLGPVFCEWDSEIPDERPTEFSLEFNYTYVDENGETVKVLEDYTYIGKVNMYAEPSSEHLLGTDDKGFDVLVRLMYGGRISLMIGFIVVILETLIGIVLGGLAGYFGGWVDQLIMRIVDIFNCIPTLPILLIASAVIDSWNLSPDQQIYVLMVVITLFSWSGVARLVRGQIISLREQEYMTATEVMGLPTWRKIFRHLIPNVMPQLIVSMTLGLGSVILYESTLSYLGLGVQLPKAAWGTMISQVNDPIIFQYHMNVWLPAGILIVIAVLGFNFIGDGLRDAMDPKARK